MEAFELGDELLRDDLVLVELGVDLVLLVDLVHFPVITDVELPLHEVLGLLLRGHEL